MAAHQAPRPWDSPGKNTGVGCHFLLQCMKVKSESEVAQSCLTLNDHMDCTSPDSSVHGIFQARVLEWGAIAFSKETPGVTGKFSLGVPNEAEQRLIEFWQENTLVIANTLFQQHKRRLYTWASPDGQHRNQIDYILCSKDGEGLFSHQKHAWDLTVAWIMNSLLQNSDLN